jgi:dipeptidyl aminopeptidase/acylaminoacyl peptidase
MKLVLTLLTAFLTFCLFSQKKTLDHTVYNGWKSLKNQSVSKDGRYISYEITPHRGDGYLYLFDNKNKTLDSFFRSTNASFSPKNDFLVFKKTAGFDTLRKCELEKVDKENWPKDSLFILRLIDRDLKSTPTLKSVTLSEETNWLAYAIDSNYVEPKAAESKKKKKLNWFKKKKKEEPKKPTITSDGNLVYLTHPTTDTKIEFRDVSEYQFSPNGEFFLYKTQQKVDKEELFQLFIYDFAKKESFQIDKERTNLSNFAISSSDKLLAYLASSDTSKVKNNRFYLYSLKERKHLISLDSSSVFIDSSQAVSKNQSFVFTENEKYLFLGLDKLKTEEPKDSLLDTEKAKLDIWHYQEMRNQPMQLLQLSKDKKQNTLHALNLLTFELIALENDSIKTAANNSLVGDYILGRNDDPYAASFNWDFPFASDHYRISLVDGTKELVKKKIYFGGELSPSGNHYAYFDKTTQQHFLVDLETKKETCISYSIAKINWQQDGNGMPHVQYPLGMIGWERGERALFLQSEFDIWKYDVDKKHLSSITNGQGKEMNIEFRPRVWERDSVYISAENFYLMGTDLQTKDEMVYQWIDHGNHHDLIELYRSPHSINSVEKSENDSSILIRKSNVSDYADAFLLDNNFKNEIRISNTNPQQSEYNWATVELMDYTSYDGQKLQALVYKPENFDTTRQYPLLVYFYELYTDRMHSHYPPKPTASIIFPTEYASAGYVVLIPDIRYEPGHPAKSAYNCIMASTDEVLRKHKNIDEKRMGLQGQSWGGYQTAQLVTMTTRYSAAMAGAPVSNMFSAYGGIRWGSGMNRQFQYEKTQSRIGKTIWEAPELYVENSPLFHLPRVETPLLIMHNDEDGAVPWYQGIELFMGMKRLEKPCWLLNYNGDDHNLMKNANRMDLSIRMRQFFDYYLLGAPAPKWLVDGIPALDKGTDYGLDLKEQSP